MIVFNPESGPGTAADPAYTQVIAQAQAAGIVMVGYVATSYGARPEADVIADINRYYDFYTLSGIYFAEGPMDDRLHGDGGDVPPDVGRGAGARSRRPTSRSGRASARRTSPSST